MSVFKKITSFLFEESEEDVIVEDELTNVYMKEQKEETYATEEIVLPKVEESQPLPKKTQQSSAESSRFVSINLHEESQKPVRKDYEQLQKPIRVKAIKHEEKKEYEFTPVISPMFGADEEEKKKEKTKKVIVPAPITSRKHKKKENPLGTIISPYFGVDEHEEHVEEKEEVVEQAPLEVMVQHEEIEEVVPVVEDTHTFMDIVEKNEVEEDVTVSLSLEDMLLSKGRREIKEETLQISIFGNHSPVKKEESDFGKNES